MAKLALLIGNGFSIDFVDDLGINQLIDTRCDALIPPLVNGLVFNPIPPQDQAYKGEFWRENIWPFLHECRQRRWGFWDICAYFAKKKFSERMNKSGAIVYRYSVDILEFKFYLYHLFVEYSLRFDSVIENGRKDFLQNFWPIFLENLLNKHDAYCISYNYDTFLESTLNEIGHLPRVAAPWGHSKMLVDQPVRFGEVLCIKPHGSVLTAVGNSMVGGILPWLTDQQKIRIHGAEFAGMPVRFEFPPKSLPLIPDLLPPGSESAQIEFDDNDGLKCSLELLKDTEIVLSVGFNGGHADQPETNRLVRAMASCRRVISVLPKRDWGTAGFHIAAARCLSPSQFVAVDPSEKNNALRSLLEM